MLVYTIDELCKQYDIKNYSINSDGSIDVDGDVYLHRKGLNSLPLRFNVVSGAFYCNHNNLTSLEGSPKEVGVHFKCNDNFLTSLEYCTKEIGGDFDCNSNILTSLEFSPKEIGGNFYCSYINNLPYHFIELYYRLNEEEKKIFLKYQTDLRIWDNVYDEEQAQLLYEEIKDGLL